MEQPTPVTPVIRTAIAACGYALLVAGADLVSTAVLRPENPVWNALIAAGWALFFFPLCLMLIGPDTRKRMASADLPGLEPEIESGIRKALSDSETRLFLFRPEYGEYRCASSELAFSAAGALANRLSGGAMLIPRSQWHDWGASDEIEKLRLLNTDWIAAFRSDDSLTGFLLIAPRRDGSPHTTEEMNHVETILETGRRQAGAPAYASLPRVFIEGLLSASDLASLLEWIHVHATTLIPMQSFRIALPGPAGTGLSYAWFTDGGARRPELEGVPIPVQDDALGIAAGTGSACFFDSLRDACRARHLPVREPESAWAGVPLICGSHREGWLVATRTHPFSTTEQRRLLAIARYAAPAILRVRSLAALERESAQHESLVRSSRRLAAAPDLAALLPAILEGAVEISGCAAALALIPERTGFWEVKAGWPGALAASGVRLPEEHPILARAASSPGPVRFDGIAPDDPLAQAAPAEAQPARHALILPLRRKEVTLGLLAVFSDSAERIRFDEDEPLLSVFSGMAASAMENARLYSQTDRSLNALVEELASLQRLDRELNTALDADRALAITLDWAIRHTESAAGLALAFHGETSVRVAARGYPPGALPDSGASLPEHLSAPIPEEDDIRVFRREGESGPPGLLASGKAVALLSVQRERRKIGLILLESDLPAAFPPAQVEFLRRITGHAAIAVANAQLNAEVRSANQAKNEFVSFVAHELKTPMTSIRGYTDLLAQGMAGPVNPQQANFLATIRTNADRLANLVSDLNDISRIESGRLKLEFSHCAFRPALEEVVDGLRAQLEAKEHRLQMELPETLPDVWVDRGRLIQILLNLVSNAYKYTPAGGSIRIAVDRSPNRWDAGGPADVLHIAVQDTGLGIAPQDQAHIFQKFFRAEDRSIRDLPGTGLGLHITRNLVEMQGGRIWFESELHKGTTFHLTLPVASTE